MEEVILSVPRHIMASDVSGALDLMVALSLRRTRFYCGLQVVGAEGQWTKLGSRRLHDSPFSDVNIISFFQALHFMTIDTFLTYPDFGTTISR